MSTHVHVIASATPARAALMRILRDSGCRAAAATPETDPAHFTPPPAVCIVDLAGFESAAASAWEKFVAYCRNHRSACLGYHSAGKVDRTCLERLRPAADWLFSPDNPDEVNARLDVLAGIRELLKRQDELQRQARRQQEELEEALQSAAEIQRRLIPQRQPNYQTLSYAWRFRPSRKVGGDLFNIARLDETSVMTYLMDVSGHGISSAMVAVAVQQSLLPQSGHLPKKQKETPPYYEITSPSAVLSDLDREFPFERFEEFFTLTYLLIDETTGRVRYCSAGHPAPILVRCNGAIEHLDCGGTIIGLGSEVVFEEGVVVLSPGDRLFLYTDGVTEHGTADGDVFGISRLEGCLRRQHPDGLEGSLTDTIERLLAFGGRADPQDDITLVGIQYAG